MAAQRQVESRERQDRLRARKERRESVRRALLAAELGRGGTAGEDGGEERGGEDSSAPSVGPARKEMLRFSSGVTVAIEPLEEEEEEEEGEELAEAEARAEGTAAHEAPAMGSAPDAPYRRPYGKKEFKASSLLQGRGRRRHAFA